MSRRRTIPSRANLGLFGLLGCLGLMGCRGPEAAEPTICRECNVVLVLADTLRADHLRSYGYPRVTSPFLDRLAETNIRFHNVRSQSGCTFPSVNSLLTSRHVFEFLDPSTWPTIPGSTPSLAEWLADSGYRTAAISASPIVRATPSEHNPLGGFGRGFDTFDERCLWREADCVTARAVEALEALEPPFFLYAHYMDVHDPYSAPAELQGVFAEPYRGQLEAVAAGTPNPLQRMLREGGELERLLPEDIAHLSDLYDEEILAFDAGLRRLYRALERRGWAEQTIFIVASDHGEGFYEHGSLKHCATVYDEETRVPLILRLPGLEKPIARDRWVENLDIVPTVLDYLGLDIQAPFAGKSLRPLIEAGRPVKPFVVSAMGAYRSLNDNRFKLIFELSAGTEELFDLEADPGELASLAASQPEIVRGMAERLRAWMSEVEEGSPEDRLRRVQEIESELRALGYLG